MDNPDTEKDRIRRTANAEQGATLIADVLPQMWCRMYRNLRSYGLSEEIARDFTRAYILSSGKRRKDAE